LEEVTSVTAVVVGRRSAEDGAGRNREVQHQGIAWSCGGVEPFAASAARRGYLPRWPSSLVLVLSILPFLFLSISLLVETVLISCLK
jgi:hypothetical protein